MPTSSPTADQQDNNDNLLAITINLPTMADKRRTWDMDSTLSSSISISRPADSHPDTPESTAKQWQSCSSETPDKQEDSEHANPFFEHDDDDVDTNSIALIRKSDPHSGGVYLILDVSQTRALTCHQGQVRLEPISLDNKHVSMQAQWICAERNGFKGFKNVAGGGFLGHDLWWDFCAKAPWLSLWESFTIDRRESGLYWIKILHWWTQWQVSARNDGSGVWAEREKGTLWEFVKVLSLGEGI
ncbi:dynamin family [Fusarium heterosporum]|uniref:Dynamin family n=1 Tax=Fusarium heterosporum TaxID=42747 RepID=A0A8H5TN08_FUSHE|nr:dynamin family [Fusarium heterosporum]